MSQVHNSLSTVMLIRYNEDSQELFPLRREVRVFWMGEIVVTTTIYDECA